MTKYIILFICLFSLFNSVIAQQIPYVKYTTVDGLVQNQVIEIMQDSRGYIWLGTKGGVSKFNGDRFENFTVNDGLPHSYILDIKEDARGNIWISTKGGVAMYNGKELKTIVQKGIGNIYVDTLEYIWFVSEESDLLRLNTKSHTTENISEKYEVLKNTTISQEFEYDTVNERLVVVAKNKSINTYEIYSINENEVMLINNNGVTSIWLNKDGRIFGKSKNNTTIYELVNNSFTPFIHLKNELHFRQCMVDNYSNIYLHSREINDATKYGHTNRIYIINKKYKIQELPISAPVIKKILIDDENNLWAATERGLIKIINQYFTHFTSSDGLNYIWSIAEDNEGNMYFASYGKGLSKQIGENFINLFPKYKDYFNSTGFYMGAIKTQKGQLLFPTEFSLLTYYDNTFNQFPDTDRYLMKKKTGKDISAILYIYEDTVENLIFLARKGLQILDKKGEIAFIDSTNSDLCLLPSPAKSHLLTICKGKKDFYWLGTGHGLYRYNHNTSEVILYTDDTANPDYIPTKGVISSFRDYQGNLWFGGTDGLLKYEPKDGSFEFIDSLLYEKNITAITGVDTTLMIIGAGRNMVVFDLANYYATGEVDLVFYDYHSGFFGESIIQNAIFTDSRGYVWTSSTDYVTRINPKKLFEDTLFSLNTHITKVSIPSENNRYKWKVLAQSYEELSRSLQLDTYQNNIRIDFDATTFKHKNNLRFKHRLLGSNKYGQWSYSSFPNETHAIYTDLPAGNYTFEVVASNNKAASQEKVKQMYFTVSFSWLNYVLVLLAMFVVLSLVLIYFLIKSRLKKQKAETQVKELRLEALNSQFKSHSIFNGLTAIENIILDGDVDTALDYIQDLSTVIRYFLEFSKVDVIKLNEEIELLQLYLNVEKLRIGDFQVEIEIDKNMNILTEIPPMILLPYIENAVNHGLKNKKGKKKLILNVQQRNDTLLFVIQDNGIGREQAMNNQQRMKKWYQPRGMELLRERIDTLKALGKFVIDTSIEDLKDKNGIAEGTKVNIRIKPLLLKTPKK